MTNDSQPFAMDQRAFPVLPVSDRYFASQSAEEARRRLTLCLERGDGPALLVGAAGCGKTMLLEVLSEHFADSFRVVRLASTQLCTRRALLQAILYGLKKPYREHDEGELRLSLVEALSERPYELPPVALLVDEAQSLPVRLLEELRVLANQAIDGIPRMMLILAGTNTLDEAFTSPKLEAFNQRIMARCYLSPLSREETTQYVRAHIAVAGEDPDQLIADSAYKGIFQASDGVPRLINQVCDRALLLAVERHAEKIDAEAIQAAWSDLHQLPAPWHLPPTSTIQQPVSEVETGFQAVEFDSNPSDVEPVAFEPAATDSYAKESNPVSIKPVADTNTKISYEAIEFGELTLAADEFSKADETSGCCSSGGKGCGSGGCASFEATSQPQFNADEALVEISSSFDEKDSVHESALEMEEYQLEEDDDEGCIAYTFPTRPTEEFIEPESDSPSKYHEDFEPTNQKDPQEPKSDKSSDSNEELVKNPFDEPFDEEEVVLDRYSEIESFLPSSAHIVTNHKEVDFGRMFQALTPAVESLLDDVTQKIEQYDNSIGLGIVGNTPPLAKKLEEEIKKQASVSDQSISTDSYFESYEIKTDDRFEEAIDEHEEITIEPAAIDSFDPIEELTNGAATDSSLTDTVLIVEDAEAVAASDSQVHRQEYSQLFANLREC